MAYYPGMPYPDAGIYLPDISNAAARGYLVEAEIAAISPWPPALDNQAFAVGVGPSGDIEWHSPRVVYVLNTRNAKADTNLALIMLLEGSQLDIPFGQIFGEGELIKAAEIGGGRAALQLVIANGPNAAFVGAGGQSGKLTADELKSATAAAQLANNQTISGDPLYIGETLYSLCRVFHWD